LVVGGSRGIGAEIVLALTREGSDVVFSYRARARRAAEVATRTGELGRAVQADLTSAADRLRLLHEVGELSLLVLSASGGLEPGAEPGYALRLNRDAQVAMARMALPSLSRGGGTIVFLTSHWAHLYGRVEQIPAYEPIAHSKHLGEVALRALVSPCSGVRLLVVTGDIVEGTVTPLLLERASRGLTEARRREVGHLPNTSDMALAVVESALDPCLPSGHTVVVGGSLEALLRRSSSATGCARLP
jgi:NADP-dependent 3-hydroxy acid dehydrogenase YdfG